MPKTYMRAPNGEVFETDTPQYHTDCEDLGRGAKGYAARQEYAKQQLREFIKPGTTVYGIVRHVSSSSSGMSRVISFCVVRTAGDGRPYIRNINALMSDACGIKESKDHEGLTLGGCGMDMVFHGVYSLGRALFPDGFGTEGTKPGHKPRRANSRQHAARMVRAGWIFRGRNGDASGWDSDGGYALGYSSL